VIVIETTMMTTTTMTMTMTKIGRIGVGETADVSTMTIGGGDAIVYTGGIEAASIAGISRCRRQI
jgi:hypothetical protein